MLDFPASPSTGTKYPASPIAGIPQYTYDGEKWTTVGLQIANAAPATATPLMDVTPAVVGVATKYAREDHQHPTDATLLAKSANLADVSNIVTARQSIYAAPFDAMSYSGMQINGGMEISQELGFDVSQPVGAGASFCDGWRSYKPSGTAVVAVYATATGAAAYFPGFQNCILLGPNTAQPSLAAGDAVMVFNTIEGYRIRRLAWGTPNAQPLTIGFWTAHVRAGLYTGTIRNNSGTRSCAFSYTQNAANVAQYNAVTIPGCVDGTWEITNLIGMLVTFCVASGTGGLAPSVGAWYNANYFGAAGQVNAVAATSDVFRITGVVVLPGIEAPSAARSPLIMRPYDQELRTCQRYYQIVDNNYAIIAGHASSATLAYGVLPFPGGVMRAAPTVAATAPSSGWATWAANTADLALTSGPTLYAGGSGLDRCTLVWGVAGGLVAGNVTTLRNGNGLGKIYLDARL